MLLGEGSFPWACALICLLALGEAKTELAVFASAQRARERRPGKLFLCFCIADVLGSGKSRRDALRSSRDNDDQPQQLTRYRERYYCHEIAGDPDWYLAVPC